MYLKKDFASGRFFYIEFRLGVLEVVRDRFRFFTFLGILERGLVGGGGGNTDCVIWERGIIVIIVIFVEGFLVYKVFLWSFVL